MFEKTKRFSICFKVGKKHSNISVSNSDDRSSRRRIGLMLNVLPKYIFCERDHKIERSFCSPREKISLISEPLLSNIMSHL
jgi:hypothetical protein